MIPAKPPTNPLTPARSHFACTEEEEDDRNANQAGFRIQPGFRKDVQQCVDRTHRRPEQFGRSCREVPIGQEKQEAGDRHKTEPVHHGHQDLPDRSSGLQGFDEAGEGCPEGHEHQGGGQGGRVGPAQPEKQGRQREPNHHGDRFQANGDGGVVDKRKPRRFESLGFERGQLLRSTLTFHAWNAQRLEARDKASHNTADRQQGHDDTDRPHQGKSLPVLGGHHGREQWS